MSSSSPSSSNGPSRPGFFIYNIAWMDTTFHTRKHSESLLGPELENGNLTRRDYDALMVALPGVQYSDLTGFAVSAVGTLWYSRFKPPKVSVGLVGYLCGAMMGKAMRVYTHRDYLRSIENINGFARAMENVKRKVGYSPGILSLTRPLSFTDEERPFQQEADTPYGESVPESMPQPAPAPAVTSTSASPPSRGKSRWEEIRAARRADGPSKAWENIRQGRRPDGTPLPKPRSASESRSGQSSEPLTFRDSDRAVEQASFDAMLERERKMSSS
ncbi:hypothetical protein B0H19DRAFT_641748 [Mycena capillaripes]|nr:hypothetical protein B0H19DRAFT_641748 [Mycena capillaripes]